MRMLGSLSHFRKTAILSQCFTFDAEEIHTPVQYVTVLYCPVAIRTFGFAYF